MIEFEVVLADYSIVQANSTHNSDLYWALSGAGHSAFGIVTSFVVRTIDTSVSKFQFRKFKPKDDDASNAPEALVQWQNAFVATEADRRLTTIFTFGTWEYTDPSYTIEMQFNGTNSEFDDVLTQSGILGQ